MFFSVLVGDFCFSSVVWILGVSMFISVWELLLSLLMVVLGMYFLILLSSGLFVYSGLVVFSVEK